MEAILLESDAIFVLQMGQILCARCYVVRQIYDILR